MNNNRIKFIKWKRLKKTKMTNCYWTFQDKIIKFVIKCFTIFERMTIWKVLKGKQGKVIRQRDGSCSTKKMIKCVVVPSINLVLKTHQKICTDGLS